MSAELSVVIGRNRAGVLARDRRGLLRFRYDPDYQALPSPTPLSVSMPVEVDEHPDGVIAPWLAGLLPDDERVTRRWARQFRSGSSPFALLGTPVGEDCAGAVRIVPPERERAILEGTGAIEWLSEADVATRLRDLRDDATTWLGPAGNGRFSLAGAQAKTALVHRDGRWGLPSGAAATSHILKPAVAGLDDHDLNEHLCLAAARSAGLVAARTRVGRFEDQSAIVIERYDRVEGTDGLVRIHQEDLCQALSVHPSVKYESEGGPGAVPIIALLRAQMPSSLAEASVWRFVDALAWSWLIAGTDGHAKNYSLLLAGSQVRLAPLYDVASALPYRELHERRLRLAMRIGRDYRVHLRYDPWPRAASMWGLDPERLRLRVRELADSAPDAFAQAAASEEVAALESELPARLTDLISERAARCLAVIGAG